MPERKMSIFKIKTVPNDNQNKHKLNNLLMLKRESALFCKNLHKVPAW